MPSQWVDRRVGHRVLWAVQDLVHSGVVAGGHGGMCGVVTMHWGCCVFDHVTRTRVSGWACEIKQMLHVAGRCCRKLSSISWKPSWWWSGAFAANSSR